MQWASAFKMFLLTITYTLLWITLIVVLIHYAALFFFFSRLKRTIWTKDSVPFTPKTMVLLPLRGADPSLAKSLEKILTQDYPHYHVLFIFDSAEDSALPYAEAAIAQWGTFPGETAPGETAPSCNPRAEIKIMPEYFSTCSLKCSALYYGMANLDSSYEVVAVLDADTNPPRNWLRHLVEPLADQRFPVATGLRWYIPGRANVGSLVRYLWNAAAVVQQELYRIPWGGSLAIRREFLEQTNIPEKWRFAITDDTPIKNIARNAKGRVAVVPTLFMVNRETCRLRSFYHWVKRQMLMAKLYHPAWTLIWGQAVLISAPLVALTGTFLAGLFLHDGQVVLWSLLAFGFYWAGVFGTLPMIESVVRKIVRNNGEPVQKWSIQRTILTFAMIPITQGVYISALFRLCFLRRVEWRGVEYDIAGQQIRLVEYKPYTQSPADHDKRQSL